MSGQPLRIGTRKSVMALAQTEGIARLLRAADPALDVEIVKFETRGDQDQTSKLLRHGGKGGAFVAEIREAMRSGTLQAAMHSLKDMPGNEETPGLVLAATLARDAANDSLVLRPGLTLDAFRASRGKGFMIGTNAVRRAAYLRRLFPEATVIHFRGAADTRIAKLDRGAKQRLARVAGFHPRVVAHRHQPFRIAEVGQSDGAERAGLLVGGDPSAATGLRHDDPHVPLADADPGGRHPGGRPGD